MPLLQPPACPRGGRRGHWPKDPCPDGKCPLRNPLTGEIIQAGSEKPPAEPKATPKPSATKPKVQRLTEARKLLAKTDTPAPPAEVPPAPEPALPARKGLTAAQKQQEYRKRHGEKYKQQHKLYMQKYRKDAKRKGL